jgi:hypothetical protein
LEFNDIHTSDFPSNPILSATLIAQLGLPDGVRTRSVSRKAEIAKGSGRTFGQVNQNMHECSACGSVVD